MNSTRKQIEIAVHLNNKLACVAEVMVIASAPPVEILTSCFYWRRDGAVVLLVTEDPQRIGRALTSAGFLCQTDSVLLLGPYNQLGAAAQIAARLAAPNRARDVLRAFAKAEPHYHARARRVERLPANAGLDVLRTLRFELPRAAAQWPACSRASAFCAWVKSGLIRSAC
jgi:hypothetical protein